MCMNCFSSVDALAVASTGGIAAASTVWQRVTDGLRGRSRAERAQLTWASDATFLAGLGHDPVGLLGPPPAIPEPTEPDASVPTELVRA